MKQLFTAILTFAVLASCSEESTTVLKNEKDVSEEQAGDSNVPQTEEETEVTITFASGPLNGTHTFKPAVSDAMSQVNVGYDKNVSTLSATKLISSDGKHQLMITRPFQGEATKGSHAAKQYTNDCGTFKLRSLSEEVTYSTIRGSYQNCTNTTVKACGTWNEGHVYNSRGVVAEFEDVAELEIALSDGSVNTMSSKMNVLFKAREARLMQK